MVMLSLHLNAHSLKNRYIVYAACQKSITSFFIHVPVLYKKSFNLLLIREEDLCKSTVFLCRNEGGTAEARAKIYSINCKSCPLDK